MTEEEFAKYLFGWLINSGEDCCSKCAHCEKRELCDNHIANESGTLNDDICYQGLYEYAKANQK